MNHDFAKNAPKRHLDQFDLEAEREGGAIREMKDARPSVAGKKTAKARRGNAGALLAIEKKVQGCMLRDYVNKATYKG